MLCLRTVMFKIVVVSLCFKFVISANILWLAGLASPSHQLWGGVIQRDLASRGHNITALSVDVNVINNVTFIHLEGVYDFYKNRSYNVDSMIRANSFASIDALAKFRTDACIPILKSAGLKRLMEYPRDFRFDLVIHDFAAAHCLLGLVPHFGNPPLVSLSASTCPVAISGASGNPQFPGFVPANHLSGYEMSGFRRFYNLALYIYDNIVRSYYMMPTQNTMARGYFDDRTLDVAAISKASVLTLVNLPPSDVMQPFYQTVVPVGGLHIQRPNTIETDLLKFIETAEDGVVYFALGTNIKSENFSHLKIKHFLDAFAQFPTYRFLWKFDPQIMNHTLPKNVMVKKWLPQNDILAHKFTKVFIGHGGALSSQEAQWYGIPQLLIPFFIDQRQNSARATERQIALQLDHHELTVETIKTSLEQLINDPKYKDNSLALSRSFHDQIQPPLERAVFWIEYAIRNGRNNKLRSPGQDLGIFQQLSFDVLLAIVLIINIQILLLKNYLWNLFFSKN